jgi:hypothetical protein
MNNFNNSFLLKTSMVFCLAFTASPIKSWAISESTGNLDNLQDQEVICVMPEKLASQEEIESISQAHGTLIELIGQGPEAMLRVKTDDEDFVLPQKAFVSDKRYSQTERDCIFMIEEGQTLKAKLAKLGPLYTLRR